MWRLRDEWFIKGGKYGGYHLNNEIVMLFGLQSCALDSVNRNLGPMIILIA